MDTGTCNFKTTLHAVYKHRGFFTRTELDPTKVGILSIQVGENGYTPTECYKSFIYVVLG